MLTQKQYQLLIFINQRIKQTGICPSYDEMAQALGVTTRSAPHRIVSSLKDRGFVRPVIQKGARTLEVVRMPDIHSLPQHSLTPDEIAWCLTHPDLVRTLISSTSDDQKDDNAQD